ncbi:MAG TPA: hypothetical protein VF099_01060 [Ktedonobacterales bacterium]
MFDFLVHVHLSMFFVLVAAGSICFFWGLGILIFRRPASTAAVAVEQKGAVEQPATVSAEGTNATPAQTKKEESAPSSSVPTKKEESVPSSPAPGRPAGRSLFRSALYITGYLALFQAILGGILVLMGGRPTDQLHYVYGLVVLLAVPVASVYASGKREHARRDLIIFVIAALIVAAAAVRAFMTGS